MTHITANITTPGEFREENPYSYNSDVINSIKNGNYNAYSAFEAEHPLLPALDASNNPLPKGWCGKVELVYQIRFRDRKKFGQYKNWISISKDEFEHKNILNFDTYETRRIYRSIEPAEAVKEVDKQVKAKIARTEITGLQYAAQAASTYSTGVKLEVAIAFDAGKLERAQWHSQQDRERIEELEGLLAELWPLATNAFGELTSDEIAQDEILTRLSNTIDKAKQALTPKDN